jgi:hypothetical protein
VAISERARREVAAASSADTARQKWRQRPEVCSLTSAQWPSSGRRLALADMRRGELVDGERPEVKRRGAPPLHTSRAVRLGLLALETTRLSTPARNPGAAQAGRAHCGLA